MFQLPPIPDVAARLNQMRQSATLAPIQQAQQQRGQVFQPSLPRGGGNGLAQGAAGLGEGLKTVAAVLKERKEEEAAGAFVDDFLQKYGPQSQTVPASFADGPTGDNVQQMAATKPATSAPFGFTTDAMAMLGTLPKREAAQLIQHRMVTWKPETFDLDPNQLRFRMGPGGKPEEIARGVDKLTVPSPQTQIAKIRLDARNNLITPEDADAQIRVLQMEGQPLDREALKRFGFRPGTVAYWKDGVPVVGQAPEATEKPVPGRDVPLSPEVLAQQIEKQKALGQNATETRAFTENETKAAGFAVRMDNANEKLSALTKGGFDPTTFGAGVSSTVRDWVPFFGNAIQGSSARRYHQLMNDWVSANLRKESGAVLGKDEIEDEGKKYFPMPFDDAAMVAQKAESRRLAEAGMRTAGGRAYTSLNADLGGQGAAAGWSITRVK
jgi:hypothetical protein